MIINSLFKVQVGNVQENALSELPLQTPKWEKNLTTRFLILIEHIVSQMSRYFPIGGHSVTRT